MMSGFRGLGGEGGRSEAPSRGRYSAFFKDFEKFAKAFVMVDGWGLYRGLNNYQQYFGGFLIKRIV